MKQNKKAFTLIEILVVVLIIGILAAIAVPQYQKAVIKSRYTQLKLLAQSLVQAQEAYYLANNTYSVSFRNLDISIAGTPTSNEDLRRLFDWGVCEIDAKSSYKAVACYNSTVNMGYQYFFKNSPNYPGKRFCYFYANQSEIQEELCKDETGAKTPSGGNSSMPFYLYQ